VSTPKFNAWRLAEHRAQDLERDVQAAAVMSPPMPSVDWCELAVTLRLKRRAAQDAFIEAMFELRANAALLGRERKPAAWRVVVEPARGDPDAIA